MTKYPETIKEWLGTDNQLSEDIMRKKYLLKGETFPEFLERVTAGDQEVKRLICEKKFLYGGRILANRGLNKLDKRGTLSNCYVLPEVVDSLDSIYDTCRDMAKTYAYGGGVGIDISKLAPKGAKVNNSAKETSGAVSFMPTFSQVTEQIGQSGRRKLA